MKYFDFAASCPLDDDAAQIYLKTATDYYGNSLSLHDTGSTASCLLETCREEIAAMLGVDQQGVHFTSGGSEANFLGIMALLSAVPHDGRHIITSAAEHSSVFNTMKKLESDGWEVTFLSLNSSGIIEPDRVLAAIRQDTALISLQHGNPEIGTIQPIQEIGELCRDRRIFLHTDCVQTFCKIPVNQIAKFADSLTISAHKFYGPKGTGAAYINPKLAWKPFLPATTHENGFRPGTVNVPGISAMTVAAQKAYQQMTEEFERMKELRGLFIDTLSAHPVRIFGNMEGVQLPGIIGLGIKGIEGQYVLLECNRRGFAISTGTACHAGMHEPARTMVAMGVSGKEAKEFFRISFGKYTNEEDVQRLAIILSEIQLPHASI